MQKAVERVYWFDWEFSTGMLICLEDETMKSDM